MRNFLDSLDHPVMFLIFLLVALTALRALAKWGFTRLNMPGPAALFS